MATVSSGLASVKSTQPITFESILGTISAELQPVAISVKAVEDLIGNKSGEEKLAAATTLSQSVLAGIAIAQPHLTEKLSNVAAVAPSLINTFVSLFNVFGIFKKKAK